ncbi:MAG TPA: response regulator, partial [Pararobbsia sp.]|nr:response regulator [Pararobbsia sp.]
MKNGETVGIILIEDDDGHATLVERNLRRAGLTNGFTRFADGQEALDWF